MRSLAPKLIKSSIIHRVRPHGRHRLLDQALFFPHHPPLSLLAPQNTSTDPPLVIPLWFRFSDVWFSPLTQSVPPDLIANVCSGAYGTGQPSRNMVPVVWDSVLPLLVCNNWVTPFYDYWMHTQHTRTRDLYPDLPVYTPCLPVFTTWPRCAVLMLVPTTLQVHVLWPTR